MYSPLYRFPQDDPWLPHRAWHHAYAIEFVVSILWPVTAAHGHRQASDVAAELEAAFRHRVSDDVAEERIARDHHVRARHEYAFQRFAEVLEKIMQSFVVLFRKHSETRQRRALVAIEGRRDAPHPAFPVPELRLFLFGIFDEPVGWVGHHGVNGAWLHLCEDDEAVALVKLRLADEDAVNRCVAVQFFFKAILPAAHPLEHLRYVHVQV